MSRAEIVRDEWGIPHIFAENRSDAFFAQGYVHAHDRLWQMVFDRYKAQGRSAELIGSRGVTLDTFIRRMGLMDAAAADLELLTPDELRVFEDYSEGVNEFISTGRKPVELELLEIDAEPWSPIDCLAVWKSRHVFMGSKAMKLWRSRLIRALGSEAMTRLASADGREELLIVPVGGTERWTATEGEIRAAAEAWAEGSNSWGLAGDRTASGAPLIAGDPHRLLETPNVYVQMQLVCDSFDVVGLTIPGTPGFPHFGHNGDVAWCITHAMADDQDLYRERFDDQGRVRNHDGWSEPARSRQTILVHDAEPIEIEVVRTARGPVVFGDPASGEALSIRWTGSDEPRRGLACLGPMLEVRTAEEMDEAMREWVFPCNSMIIADKQSLRYLHRGRVPIRSTANGWLPVPGWDERVSWGGDVPFDEMPRAIDPKQGKIVTANNRVAGAEYPYRLATDYAAPNRARRIHERLDAIPGGATIKDMASIHADSISIAGRVFLDALLKIDPPTDPLAAAAFEELQGFDADMKAGSVAATIMHQARHVFLDLLLDGPPLDVLNENIYPEEPLAVPPQARIRSALQRLMTPKAPPWFEEAVLGDRTREDLLREAFDRAIERLRDRFGDDIRRWTYERIHRTEIRHPLSARFPEAGLDPPSVAMDGDGDSVLVSADEIGYGVYHSSVARYVFDLSDRSKSGWIVPLGASGHPRSPHHADQLERWSRCELIPVRSDREELMERASEVQELERSR